MVERKTKIAKTIVDDLHIANRNIGRHSVLGGGRPLTAGISKVICRRFDDQQRYNPRGIV